jgi:hypothetical protein
VRGAGATDQRSRTRLRTAVAIPLPQFEGDVRLVLIRVENEPPRNRLDYFRHVADSFVPFDLRVDAYQDLRVRPNPRRRRPRSPSIATLAYRRGLPLVQKPPPAGQNRVDVGRADDRLLGERQIDRRKEERAGLRAAHAAVEGDQLLEGAPLVELRVVEAVHEQVGRVLETVRAREVLRSIR